MKCDGGKGGWRPLRIIELGISETFITQLAPFMRHYSDGSVGVTWGGGGGQWREVEAHFLQTLIFFRGKPGEQALGGDTSPCPHSTYANDTI